jgi:transposase InsO family protein
MEQIAVRQSAPGIVKCISTSKNQRLGLKRIHVNHPSWFHPSWFPPAEFVPSMSRPANPYDNASCESFMKTLKREEIYANRYDNLEQMR